MMKFSTAVARILAAGVLMAFAGLAAAQQAYPNKPIRIIVPFPPGGSIGILARLIGQKLTESWSQPVIVDYRPGGNTVIGTEALVRSLPDGYTLILMGPGHIVTPLLQATSYDPVKDFAPVATISSSEFILVLNPSVPANNLQEFIALAKARPGQLNVASSGTGTSPHLAAELFNILAGVKIQHIPYKGSAPGVTDLIGGQVQLFFQTPIAVIPHIKSGKLKAIAVSGESRLSALPQLPTFTEAGLQGFEVRSWQGVLAPAGTPKAVIDKLSTEIAKIVATRDFREKLVSQGLEPFIATPDQVVALIKADIAKYGKVIKTANIKLEN